jgi:single-strand DNA-binding protein
VATSRSWNTSEGEKRVETEWFNVVAWGNLAEICKQYLSKGQQVYIEGRLQTRNWDDSEGNKHTSTEIVANEMIMLSERKEPESSLEGDVSEEDEFPF